VRGATIEDLDLEAIQKVKNDLQKYKTKEWESKYKNKDDKNLLKNLGLIEFDNEKVLISNTCILMLGKNELFENDKRFYRFARIQWQYYPDKDVTKYGKSRENYYIPLYPVISQIWDKIDSKNDPLANQNLYQGEEKQYEEITIRELLLNSIAHRDYVNFETRPFVEIIQDRESITFRNSGNPPFESWYELEINQRKKYRNPCLANFLCKVGLMDQEALGLLDKVIDVIKGKGFNMPVLRTENNETWITINTIVKNVNFTKKLFARSDVTRKDAILLDSIMQGKNSIPKDISKENAQELKDKGLVEIRGTKNIKCYLSKKLSEIVEETESYVVDQGYTKEQMFVFINKHIDSFGYVRLSNLRIMFPKLTDDARKNLLSRSGKYLLIKKGIRSKWYYIKNTQ
jgi:predicted HTH transcriptional regulator